MMAKKILSFDLKKVSCAESAIIPIDNQTFIYVIGDQNIIKVEVFTGKRFDGKVEIKKGLKFLTKLYLKELIS